MSENTDLHAVSSCRLTGRCWKGRSEKTSGLRREMATTSHPSSRKASTAAAPTRPLAPATSTLLTTNSSCGSDPVPPARLSAAAGTRTPVRLRLHVPGSGTCTLGAGVEWSPRGHLPAHPTAVGHPPPEPRGEAAGRGPGTAALSPVGARQVAERGEDLLATRAGSRGDLGEAEVAVHQPEAGQMPHRDAGV